jgi:tetratricopeptide (TPR) repeat protein
LRTPGIGRQGRLAIGVIAAVALVAVVIAVDPGARIESFKQTGFEPRSRQQSTGQLLSLEGGGRYQFWSAAVDQFRANPVLGGGAGAYEFWWAENPRFPYYVRDAHSLWLEILGELGLVGLILAVGAFGYGILVALRRVRGYEGPDRILVAALGATLFAWAFAAAIDWMWEMTVVSAVAVICLGLMTGPATARRPPLAPSSRGSRAFSVGVAVIAAAWLVICAQASPLLSETRIADSQAAAERGDSDAALNAARGARTLQPWAGGPYRQLALIEEERARFTVARGYIQEAIAREPGNAELWRDAARIERGSGNLVGAGQRFERARRLDPSLSAARRRSAR